MSDASALIDARIAELADWRGRTLAHVRALIHAADPAVVEEWKWRGTPVWSHDGILCTETYKAVVKLTFAHGAALPDPTGLFNASLEGNTHRYPRNRRAGRARLHDPDPGRRRPERSEADKGLTAMTLRWIIPLALALALSSCSAARIDGSTRQFSGVWLYEFEGSTFVEGAT
ncbi:DUF1801 domain-containing protein, partial [Brevundimonas sp.]|uniref:DUF1801 domain-containing protein n=1 Tax=Brevundimonas sp. TaxID=1871086 RepID=UPI0025BC0152